MADLKNYTIFKNENFEVLTDSGFQPFEGIIIGENRNKIQIQLDDEISLICTPKHKLILKDGSVSYAHNIQVGDQFFSGNFVTRIENIENNDMVYELLHVHNGHKYFVNKNILCEQCLIVDECAFIAPHIMDEFWNSVVPIISSSSNAKIFLISTANGSSNRFYDIYSKAERGESREWHHERIDWWEIPGRGKKWQQDMIESLGSKEAFEQEFGNCFLETGESAITGTILDRWRNFRRPPILTLEDGHYQIWEEPKENHIYTIGVDVSEGVGEAASVAQVLDITDLTNIRQVACFHDALIDPHFFAEILFKIANQWGRPYLAIERNNAGGQVLDALYHTHGYNKFLNITSKGGAQDRLGIYSSTGTKYKGVSNMRYWINTLDVVEIQDIGLIHELETFIRRPNGVWKKKDGQGVRDDRVDALFWALMILETEVCQQYYDIVAFDDRGKPKKIKNVYIESPEFYKLDKMYQTNANSPTPLLFGFGPDDPDEFNETLLKEQGWMTLNNI
jgi:hypothetical protein